MMECKHGQQALTVNKIDWMLIPAVQNLNATITDYKSWPTMLFWNPNAGFYEYITYQSEWLSYINLGINVAIWNYRGYGRSQGSPSPKLIRKDGEYVLKHFVDHFGLSNLIGVHGESLGGSVAWYIARTWKVDFLFADRTFSKLTDIPLISFGRIARWLYIGLTWFYDEVAFDYLEAKCYKVVGWDPNDQIINELCSLKYGISKLIVDEASKFNNKNFKFDNYFHILSQDEGKSMEKAIKFLLNLNKKMQIWKANFFEEEMDSTSKDDELNYEGSDKVSPNILHQSQLDDIEKNRLDDSLSQEVSHKFKQANQNNSVMIEKRELEEHLKKKSKVEHLETYHDADPDFDEKFFQITNPGVFDASSGILLNRNKLDYK